MKRTIAIIILLFLTIQCQGQTHREYFFDDKLAINDSTSLVLIIQDPQTQFARELNHRIYSDTNFIRQLKETWFREVDDNIIRSGHMCGHDMYFYSLSDSSYVYLNQLNSNCNIAQIGCTNLNVLLQSGRPLHIDTIRRLRINAYKKDFFSENLFRADYSNVFEWEFSKTDKYPQFYYDGKFKTKIQLDTSYSITQNAENFIRTFTDDFDDINWTVPKYAESDYNRERIKDFEWAKTPCEVEMIVFLKSSRFAVFKDFTIEKVKFELKKKGELLMFYRD